MKKKTIGSKVLLFRGGTGSCACVHQIFNLFGLIDFLGWQISNICY